MNLEKVTPEMRKAMGIATANPEIGFEDPESQEATVQDVAPLPDASESAPAAETERIQFSPEFAHAFASMAEATVLAIPDSMRQKLGLEGFNALTNSVEQNQNIVRNYADMKSNGTTGWEGPGIARLVEKHREALAAEVRAHSGAVAEVRTKNQEDAQPFADALEGKITWQEFDAKKQEKPHQPSSTEAQILSWTAQSLG